MEDYKIYGLKLKDSDEIKYIGMTKQSLENRLMGHISSSKRYNHKNACWLKGHKDEVEIVLIEDGILTNKDCCQKEIHYIKLFKSFGANLNNYTIGGDSGGGMSGKKQSEETRKKISESHTGKKQGPAWNKGMKGSPGGPKKGTKFSDEHRKKLSEAAKRRIALKNNK
jgi:hypothetical protein